MLSVTGRQSPGAGSPAQLATVARSTTLGLIVTEAVTRSLAQAGCLEEGHGQCRVLGLGWAFKPASISLREPGWGGDAGL